MITAPPALAAELEMMTAKQRTVFIMSGFKSSYITEWEETYNAALNFVTSMYIKRTSDDD